MSENPGFVIINGVLDSYHGPGGDLTIPDGVEKIGDSAFVRNGDLTGVTIPEGVTAIGDSAFQYCGNLQRVTLPDSLTSIGESVFQRCSALQAIDLPAGLTEIPSGAFGYCGNLQRVTLPDGLTSIGWNAFCSCGGLQAIDLPEGLTSIGWSAFFSCDGLKSIHLPKSLTELGNSALPGSSYMHTAPTVTVEEGNPFFLVEDGVLLDRRGRLIGCFGAAPANYTVPDWVKEIAPSAFQYCNTLKEVVFPEGLEKIGYNAFEHCENLVKASLPASLRELGNTAFAYCKKLRSMTILEGVTALPWGVFSDCPSLKKLVIPASVRKFGMDALKLNRQINLEIHLGNDPEQVSIGQDALIAPIGKPKALVYPNIPLWAGGTTEAKVNLVLGFCTAPEKYEGDTAAAYAKYAKSQRRRILAAAEEGKIQGVAEYYDALDAKGGKKKTQKADKPVNYGKLSALNKVIALEEAVLSGDMAKLEEVITGCKEFEYTARALGMACRYGTPEMVQRLVRAGADFKGGWDSSLKAKYDSYGTINRFFGYGGGTVERHFELMTFAGSIQNYYEFGDFRNAPKLLVDGKERKPASKEVRMENLRILCQNQKKTGCKMEYLLYMALMEGKTAWTALLRECGAKLGDCAGTFTNSKNTDERSRFVQTITYGKPKERTALLTGVLDILAAEKKELAVTLSVVQAVLSDQKLTERVLTEGDCSSLKGPELLREVVANGTSGTLAFCLENGWLKSAVTRDKLIEQSIAAKRVEHTAILLEYKNRTADYAKENEAKMAREMRELTAGPDSAFMLKKLWTTQKREDGALVITGYKGQETEVTVPAKIGKAAVTAIGEFAFSPEASRLTEARKKSRRAIARVTIPEGIQEIGRDAFWWCTGLIQVELPESLKEIGESAFSYCKLLESVSVPKGVKSISASAFEGCSSLSTVQLPEGLKKIGYKAFQRCASLTEITLPDSLREIDRYAFYGCASLTSLVLPDRLQLIKVDAFGDCPNLTLTVTAGSPAAKAAAKAGLSDGVSVVER